ncbi:MAG: T9SS type A sorting domain-containing protein [Xanthomonadales bacterium]|nr:T9SS type A sorting domain-containing protein [Xanthomonadales bacterium]
MNYFNKLNNDLFRIDVENNSFLDLNLICNNNENIFGLSSTSDVLSSACNLEVTSVDCLVDVDLFNRQTELMIFPNPAQNEIHLRTDILIESICIINFDGTIVKTFSLPSSTISVENLENGLYFLKITYRGNMEIIRKFIKI